MIAADNHGRAEFAIANHFIESQPGLVPITQADSVPILRYE